MGKQNGLFSFKKDKIPIHATTWMNFENMMLIDGRLLLNEYGVSIWDNEKVLEIDSGNACTTM